MEHPSPSTAENCTRRKRASLLAVALGALPWFAAAAWAQNIDLGKQVYQTKVGCPECHGWAGDGAQEDPRAPRGANLRATMLDRAALIMVIKCGIPGASMPYFDGRAYTDDRCYGMTEAQIGNSKPPPGTPVLIQREIEAVADYLLAKVVGKGDPNYEQCLEFFGSPVERCRSLPRAR